MEGIFSWKEDIFPSEYLNTIFEKILTSKLLGKAPFTEGFVNTKGFSIIFRRESIPKIKELFPYLSKYLDEITFQECNAFFVNSLVLRQSSQVNEHIDCRLLDDHKSKIVPNLVSVLYVKIPDDMDGGELVLKGEREHIITPHSNSLIHFVGRAVHSVNELKSADLRMSVVCEQYNLPDDMMEYFPKLKIVPGT